MLSLQRRKQNYENGLNSSEQCMESRLLSKHNVLLFRSRTENQQEQQKLLALIFSSVDVSSMQTIVSQKNLDNLQ